MNSIKICTNSMAHINHFLMYVLGYKTFSILEDCCNLLGRYGKYFVSCTIIQYLSLKSEINENFVDIFFRKMSNCFC